MSILKGIALFALAFVIAWIIIFTFSQPAFLESAPIKIFRYSTPVIPIYAHVAGAFCFGLLLGLGAAVFTFVQLSSKIHRITREMHILQSQKSAQEQEPSVGEQPSSQSETPEV